MAQPSPVAPITRRDLFRQASLGIGAIAVADLLHRDGRLLAHPAATAAATPAPGRPLPHHAAAASHVIHIYLGGGLSHVDSFDYKADLEKYHDKDMPRSFGAADPFFGKLGRLHKSHFPFKRRGQSGLWVSDLFPNIAGVADELTVINSMVAETANHIPGTYQANTGFRQMGFPSMGAWLNYGLGSMNDNLPSFVVLPDARGLPNNGGGAFNWGAGFLPAQNQGVTLNTRGNQPVLDLQPSGGLSAEGQATRR